ncbi:MAG TPA: M81 family metallopeptidase [Steroidobacteraceae bacterium]|nr:M81 family metallopeptidase [Steroidobacteraceae bacterium]
MKIFVAGIATETNTFSPIPVAFADFRIQRGKDAAAGRRPFPSLDLTEPWGRQARARGDEFVFSLMAYAEPGGLTLNAAYEALRDEILQDLQAAMPVDVVLLMLHGAMVAQEYEDCEEDLIRRTRSLVGPRAVIGVELDLHCHLRESKIAPADIVVTYKEYPHTDPLERAQELFDLALATRLGKIRPTMALFDCRMIGLYPTSREPMRAFVNALAAGERRDGVLSLSLGHGFQFADVGHAGAKLLAVTDGDPQLARKVAREYGLEAYALRREIGCESFSLPLDEAISQALAVAIHPVVIADQSDNPGGGAPGDATYALRWLLDHQIEDVGMAFFYDPEVVRTARRAGKGARLSVRLGGKLGRSSGAPVDLEATVLGIFENYRQPFPQGMGATDWLEQGTIVALRSAGLDLIVTDERGQCLSPTVFSDFGIDPKAKRMLIVKSAQHFHAAFAPIAAEIIYMYGPGAVIPDPRHIAYRRLITHRLYPWTDDPLAET